MEQRKNQKVNLDSLGPTVLSAEEKINWIRLSRAEPIGPITFFELIQRYGSAGKALDDLPEITFKGNYKRKFKIPTIEEASQELEEHHRIKADLIAFSESDYPEILRHIADPPPLISILGDRKSLQKQALAIVGARNASLNGCHFSQKLATELGSYGYQIVSGLARGIDTSAHQGALKSGTIAVLAGGIDHIYPRENRELYYSVAEQGVIIAESPFGTIPQASFFPRRNRIIAGLSLGVIIIEAAKQSGSLVTARFALEQGREVFVVPGSPLDPRSYGANMLIRQGATLIQNTDDIISGVENLGKIKPVLKQQEKKPESQENSSFNKENNAKMQQHILDLLSISPIGVDEIIRECHFSTAEVMLALLELELAGRIHRHPGGQISLKG
ncbi:MAG: DNA-processing protein DprA [Candidatus Paracaedimonas acanthamoebae]|uniref:DNA-processing protein DprA n=1 Tax=Candidatus Paracaedimonas acanthamoebae TaxID=244581 RepID=A0A8J7PRB1_9PROT|nr:DNA-processing protein DprA [Candidatus Paracaedimonas acanthamoebae]